MSDPLADLARADGVPSAIAAARDAVDAVLRDRGLSRIAASRAAAARAAAAQASAELTADPPRWLPGALRVARELPRLSATLRVAPGQVLARLHTLAAYGLVPGPDLGRPRTDPEVAARMAGLTGLLIAPVSAPAVVLGAVAHAEMIAVAPFGVADDLVARALERLVLISTGLDPAGVIVVEAGHAASPANYRAALAGYRSGTPDGVRGWLIHCAEAVALGAGRWAEIRDG